MVSNQIRYQIVTKLFFLFKKQKSANQVTEFVLRQIKVMCIGKFLCKEEDTEKQKLVGTREAGVSSNANQFWPLFAKFVGHIENSPFSFEMLRLRCLNKTMRRST